MTYQYPNDKYDNIKRLLYMLHRLNVLKINHALRYSPFHGDYTKIEIT